MDNYGALIELQRLTQDKLRQMLKTRTLRGFPINMPFTDEDEIVTKVCMYANSLRQMDGVLYAHASACTACR